MLEVEKLSRRYADFLAVDQVSFRIGAGEIVGLLGHNGAGKTTIMKMLSGYLEPDGGRVCIQGIDLLAEPKRVQRQLGYLPESLPVYPDMCVADYLDYAAELKGLRAERKRAEIRRVVAATDIRAKFLAPIATLSRGYRQRVGVAQAILGRPRLLILDEPTNGLDPTQTEQMRELIRELAREATVIVSTHIMQEVEALCQRVLIVKAGRLVVDEQLEALRRTRELALHSDLEPARALALFRAHPGVAQALVQGEAPPAHHYRLVVNEESDLDELAATLARALIEAGGKLYRLRPRQRSLESLFREVTAASLPQAREDVHHAA